MSARQYQKQIRALERAQRKLIREYTSCIKDDYPQLAEVRMRLYQQLDSEISRLNKLRKAERDEIDNDITWVENNKWEVKN